MNSSPSPIIIEIGIPATFGQLGCVDDSHALPEGWMPVFDPDPAKPWSEKLFTRDIPFSGKTLHLVGPWNCPRSRKRPTNSASHP